MQIFFAGHLRKALLAVILAVLFVPEKGSSGEPAAADFRPAPEMQVEVKLKDAARLDEILELRKSVAKWQGLATKRESELRKAESERNLLRQELLDAVTQLESRNAKIRRLELGVAGLLASGKLPEGSTREDRLLQVLNELSKSGGSLALLSVEFCGEVDAVLSKLPAGRLEASRLRLKRDLLIAESRKFSALARWEPNAGTVTRCRVLAVNPELGIAVLPVGLNHGVSAGLNYYVQGQTPEASPGRLRVVFARPLVAVAMMVDGDIRKLAPGMEVVTDLQTLINREQ